jgi:hypothetical protein
VAVTGSVAGAAFIVGSVFGLRALALNPGANARTGGGVTYADVQADAHTAHSYAVVADVSFVITAAAAGTAMFLYFANPRRAPQAVSASAGAVSRWGREPLEVVF